MSSGQRKAASGLTIFTQKFQISPKKKSEKFIENIPFFYIWFSVNFIKNITFESNASSLGFKMMIYLKFFGAVQWRGHPRRKRGWWKGAGQAVAVAEAEAAARWGSLGCFLRSGDWGGGGTRTKRSLLLLLSFFSQHFWLVVIFGHARGGRGRGGGSCSRFWRWRWRWRSGRQSL